MSRMSDLHIELEQAIRDAEMSGDTTRLNAFKKDYPQLYTAELHEEIMEQMDWEWRPEDKVITTFGSLKATQNESFQEGIQFALHMMMHNETLVRIIGEYELSKITAQMQSELADEKLYEAGE